MDAFRSRPHAEAPELIEAPPGYPEIQMGYLEVDSLRIRFARRRPTSRFKSQTPVVFFNGIGGRLELALPILQALPMEALTFDVPGVGESSTPILPYRFPHLARLSEQILERFGLGTVDIVGLSWGGALAQEFARRHPDRCERLVLAATITGMLMVPAKPSAFMKFFWGPAHEAAQLRQMAIGGLADTDLGVEALHAIRAQRSSLGYFGQVAALLNWTSIHWLHKLQQPTLILAGNDDPLVPLANAYLMDLLLSNSRRVEIHGGHLFMLTRAAEMAQLITKFLRAGDPLSADLGIGPPKTRLRA